MIEVGDIVKMLDSKAVVIELVPENQTKFPKAIVKYQGTEYCVGLSGLKLYEEPSNDHSN